MADTRLLAITNSFNGAWAYFCYLSSSCDEVSSYEGLKDLGDRKIWGFWGDGEMDEPESLGAIGLAAREKLDNLIFVTVQSSKTRWSVRGNGKVIQELERQFRGSAGMLLKLFGADFGSYLQDKGGHLQKIMDEVVDGEMQNFKAKGGAYTRENFFVNILKHKIS